MTRETRYNLIFLVVIVALLAPGGAILFKRKLEPTAKPMYLPDPVPHAIAFLSAQEVPPGMRRVAPQHTMTWLGLLADQHIPPGALRPMDEERLPLMSSERRFQVVAVEPADRDGQSAAWVLYWDNRHPLATGWSRGSGGESEDGNVLKTVEAPLPRLVREELGESGLVMPPKGVVLQRVQFPVGRPLPWQLHATWANGTRDSVNIVQTFTSPVAAKN